MDEALQLHRRMDEYRQDLRDHLTADQASFDRIDERLHAIQDELSEQGKELVSFKTMVKILIGVPAWIVAGVTLLKLVL
ncbi:MAG TPA: hypothetical protein VKY74_00495 [Chloroflexia bacterium]|nr:hypothetical protein [Chloroflexia bacterium]